MWSGEVRTRVPPTGSIIGRTACRNNGGLPGGRAALPGARTSSPIGSNRTMRAIISTNARNAHRVTLVCTARTAYYVVCVHNQYYRVGDCLVGVRLAPSERSTRLTGRCWSVGDSYAAQITNDNCCSLVPFPLRFSTEPVLNRHPAARPERGQAGQPTQKHTLTGGEPKSQLPGDFPQLGCPLFHRPDLGR